MTPDTVEQSLLGAMLLSRAAITDVTDTVSINDFRSRGHQLIFSTIIALYLRGEPADPVTVIPELDRHGKLEQVGGAPYLHTLISTVADASQAKYYAEIVSKASGERS